MNKTGSARVIIYGIIMSLCLVGGMMGSLFIVNNIGSCSPNAHKSNGALTFYSEIPAVLESAYAYPEPKLSGLRYVSIWKCEYGRIASESESVFMFAHERGLIRVGRTHNGDLQVLSVRKIDDE